jgi:hypothetical protein
MNIALPDPFLDGLPHTVALPVRHGEPFGLLEWGHKFIPYEGNRGDERAFDEKAVETRIDIVPASLNLEKPS